MYKYILLVAAIFFVFILWVVYLANTGSSSIFFEFVRSFPNGDKLGHLGLFGFLTLTAVVGLKFRSFSWGRLNIYYGAALVILFVVIEEGSQYFIPFRTFEFADLAADAVGILLATGIAYLTNKHLTRRSSEDVASDAT